MQWNFSINIGVPWQWFESVYSQGNLLQIKANAETQSHRQKNRQDLVEDYRGNDSPI
jgi:hypothetical protein